MFNKYILFDLNSFNSSLSVMRNGRMEIVFNEGFLEAYNYLEEADIDKVLFEPDLCCFDFSFTRIKIVTYEAGILQSVRYKRVKLLNKEHIRWACALDYETATLAVSSLFSTMPSRTIECERVCVEQCSVVLREMMRVASEALAFDDGELNSFSAYIVYSPHLGQKRMEIYEKACERVGLMVKKMLTRPMASAYACRDGGEFAKSRRILVFDFDGGAFDVSLMECPSSPAESPRTLAHRSDVGIGAYASAFLYDICKRRANQRWGIDLDTDLIRKNLVRRQCYKWAALCFFHKLVEKPVVNYAVNAANLDVFYQTFYARLRGITSDIFTSTRSRPRDVAYVLSTSPLAQSFFAHEHIPGMLDELMFSAKMRNAFSLMMWNISEPAMNEFIAVGVHELYALNLSTTTRDMDRQLANLNPQAPANDDGGGHKAKRDKKKVHDKSSRRSGRKKSKRQNAEKDPMMNV